MTAKNAEANYYEILEVAPSASGRDVHMAYMRAKETYSPDSPALYTMFTPEEARQLLKMIDEAFSVLSNQAKRQEYDLSLARRGHPAFSSLLLKAKEEKPRPVLVHQTPTSAHAAPVAHARAGAAAGPRIIGEEGAVLKGTRAAGGKSDLPSGFARTRFGIYEINGAFEGELSQVEECDGSTIQKLRQYKKVNLDQLSDATRVSKSYLAAIESNAYDALPAAVFVRGFVLQVVRTLGAPDRLVDAYMKHFRKAKT
jgi:curved DNA-binding protein CbpA